MPLLNQKQRQGISASGSVGMKRGRVSIELHGLWAYLILLAAQLASPLEEVDLPSAAYSYPFVSSLYWHSSLWRWMVDQNREMVKINPAEMVGFKPDLFSRFMTWPQWCLCQKNRSEQTKVRWRKQNWFFFIALPAQATTISWPWDEVTHFTLSTDPQSYLIMGWR